MDPKLFEIRCQQVTQTQSEPRPCGRCDRVIDSEPVRSYKRGATEPDWVEHCSACDLWRHGEVSAPSLWELRTEVIRKFRQRRALDSNRRLLKEPQLPTTEIVPTSPEFVPVVLQDDHECLIVEYKPR
jgi:hypothetical protein